jgi:hypothetical protein
MNGRRTGAVLALLAAGLASGCIGWPEATGGGLAERRPATDPVFTAREARLVALEREGGRRFAAVELAEASRLYVLARRSSEAGQNRRARDELTAFDALMDLAETRAAAMRDGAGS